MCGNFLETTDSAKCFGVQIQNQLNEIIHVVNISASQNH